MPLRQLYLQGEPAHWDETWDFDETWHIGRFYAQTDRHEISEASDKRFKLKNYIKFAS